MPSGVWLTCDKGAIPSQFTSTPKTIKLYGKFFATEADLIPMLNIQPFGVCSVDGYPCMPIPVQWLDVLDGGLKVSGFKPLLDCSKCQCAKSGKMEIHMTKADADNHLMAKGIQEGASLAKEVSMWAFVGAIALGTAGIICACTGVGAVATPFLFAAAVECMEVAAVSFELAIAADAAAFVVEPNKENGWVVVADAGILIGGKIIGKGLGILAEDLLATGIGRKIAIAVEDAVIAKPRFKIEGQREGGPGKWTKGYNRRGKGMKYQFDKSGTKSEYRVGTIHMKSGKKNFDDYDPNTKEFIDYKDWNNGYPPKNTRMEESAFRDATKQAKIAKEHNTVTRWEVSNEAGKARLEELIFDGVDKELWPYIKVVVNLK
ncbi:DUF4280 domain-containing protein [uncultured Cytophaga sp.]|uniref:DUF4280 domain-containing protein n=1 Tax=uncultured Cytophaga sp. TaxID=160238 RepID=UPI00261098B0|nr:DUF4280 domain-containing protein [uncultured Cytophaga sp.]